MRDKKKYDREYKTSIRKQAIAEGLCNRCCIRKPPEGLKRCDHCRKITNEYRERLFGEFVTDKEYWRIVDEDQRTSW